MRRSKREKKEIRWSKIGEVRKQVRTENIAGEAQDKAIGTDK